MDCKRCKTLSWRLDLRANGNKTRRLWCWQSQRSQFSLFNNMMTKYTASVLWEQNLTKSCWRAIAWPLLMSKIWIQSANTTYSWQDLQAWCSVLTWNLETMSKCFFMSVPSTMVMHSLRACTTSSADHTPSCSALHAWLVQKKGSAMHVCTFQHQNCSCNLCGLPRS